MNELKILPGYFQDVLFNNKRFELRKNDRKFKVNDVYILKEYDTINNEYTNNEIIIRITYVLRNVEYYGLKDGYCIFGFEILFLEAYHLLKVKYER